MPAASIFSRSSSTVAAAVVAFPQLLLDGLQLLAQIEVALRLRELTLHLRLNLVAQLDELEFARQVLVDVLEHARPHVHLLEHCLALGMAQAGQNSGYQVRQTPEFVGVGHGGGQIV